MTLSGRWIGADCDRPIAVASHTAIRELILREDFATPSFLNRDVAPDVVGTPQERLRLGMTFPWHRVVADGPGRVSRRRQRVLARP
jgi:hypothetical protein